MDRRNAAVGWTLGLLAVAVSAPACAPGGSQTGGRPSAQAEQTTPSKDREAFQSHRDGSYSARGWYGSLPSHHDVTLTIQNGTVTAVEITTPAEDSISFAYQQRFAQALPDAILGKSIDQIAVNRLAGASGCSEGFMDAHAKIAVQAAQ